MHAPPIINEALREAGQPLDATTRSFFTERFAHDFGRVRVHAGSTASDSAHAIGALAYACGDHVVFAAGRYQPGTREGLRLIGHELAHVVQQSATRSAPPADESPLEAEADHAAAAALGTSVVPPIAHKAAPGLMRQPSGSASAFPPRQPTQEEQLVIEVARRTAAIRTQIAMMRVSGIVPTGPAGRSDPAEDMRHRARRLAQVMFDWPNPNMDQVHEIVSSMVTMLARPAVLVAQLSDPECGTRSGYVRDLHPPIVLCPAFFNDTPEGQIRTMIHEAAHLSRIGTSQPAESYCVDFDCATSCGGFQSADSWAHFVHCLSDRPPDEPTILTATPSAPSPARASPAANAPPAPPAGPNLTSIADRAFKAMKGLGTDEEGVYRALQELHRDQEAINGLMKVYKERHHASLLDDIEDDFSGSEREYALQLLNLGATGVPQAIQDSEPAGFDPKTAARRIREAVDIVGTDEEAIYAALLPFQRDTLLVQRSYQEQFHEDLRDRIEDEMSGSELAYALDLLETPFERYLQEASQWLKGSSIGFGLPWNTDDWFDGRFWRREYDAQQKEMKLVLKSGTPHEAIDALFHEQWRWHVDCAVFVDVVQLYALRQSLGARRFDTRVGGRMELRAHRSTGIRSQVLFKRMSATADFTATGSGAPARVGAAEEVLAGAPIGSRVRWTSQLLFDKANDLAGPEVFTIEQQSWPAYQHENTIKLGPDRYGAQGVSGGGRLSRADIETTLTKVTAGVFPDLPESKIRAGIFISEIEIAESPELNEQIEPEAEDAQKGPRP